MAWYLNKSTHFSSSYDVYDMAIFFYLRTFEDEIIIFIKNVLIF